MPGAHETRGNFSAWRITIEFNSGEVRTVGAIEARSICETRLAWVANQQGFPTLYPRAWEWAASEDVLPLPYDWTVPQNEEEADEGIEE